MKLLALLLLYLSALAQDPAWHLDATDGCRLQFTDDPRFADPNLDDSSWRTFRFPLPPPVPGESSFGAPQGALAAWIEPGRVIIANAGNPSPYAAGRELAVLPGLPLGLASEAEYEETEFTRRPDQLTFVSDGVVEAANAHGELFGFDRTSNMSGKSASEIAEAARLWGQNDDITVVTVARTAA